MKKTLLAISYFILATFNFYSQEIPNTKKDFNNKNIDFQFVVVSDRTGGMQPGVFAEAISKVNLVQPEFVISVGDLIDGYTKNPDVWNAQWDEFDSIVDKLEMPFFHVPGNHDTSNELLLEAWRARLGRDYYHFKYKDVLFLAINTDEIEGGGISDNQIKYFEKTLQENKDVRWTLLFMHRPVWSYGDTMGYKKIENALGNRKYTLFSGHHHHYRYMMHNNMEHFTLATSGGGSNLRGANVGEFHHISWITMKEDGPKIAHLELSGIYDKNVVAEADYDNIQTLRKGDWLKIIPLVNTTETFDKITSQMVFKNDTPKEMIIKGGIKDQNNLSFFPKKFLDTLLPNSEKEVGLTITSKNGVASISKLNHNPINIKLQGGFASSVNDSIFISTSKELLMDWVHSPTKVNKKITIDGKLTEWENASFIDVLKPQYFKEDWDWKGKEDGSFKFALSQDKKNISIGIEFKDDHIITNKNISEKQDKFYVHLNSENNNCKIELAYNKNGKRPLIRWIEGNSTNLKAAMLQTKTGFTLELSLTTKEFYKTVNTSSKLQLNIGIMDHDQLNNTKPSVLWWRPLENTSSYYKEAGIFKLSE